MFKKLKAWWQLKRAQHSQFYMPKKEPAVQSTTAVPRYGIQQDFDRTTVIQKMLAGSLITGKQLVRFEIVAFYKDGTKQVLLEETSPYTKVHVEECNGVTHYIVDTTRLEFQSLMSMRTTKAEAEKIKE